MELVRVRFRDCRCPGTPHDGQDGHDDGDVAYLKPHLNFEGGAAAYAAIADAVTSGKPNVIDQYVGPVYLRYGVVGWNLLDADGQDIGFSPEAVLELPFEDAYDLVDRADDLYGKAVMSPLRKRTASSSPNGQTNGRSSTSATPKSSVARRSRSGSSSRPKASRAS